CVVGAREFAIVDLRLPSGSALVAHRLDDASSFFPDHHRRIHAWKYPMVAGPVFSALDIGQPPLELLDLGGGDALIVLRFLRGLELERAIGVGQTLYLLEQLLLHGRD